MTLRENERRMTVIRNLRWGIRGGLLFAGFLSIWVVVLVAMNLSLTIQVRGKTPVNAIAVIAVYLGAGIVGGVLVGLLRPWLRLKAVTVLATVLTVIPLSLAVRVLLKGFEPWSTEDTLLIAISSLMLTGIGSPILWAALRGTGELTEKKH